MRLPLVNTVANVAVRVYNRLSASVILGLPGGACARRYACSLPRIKGYLRVRKRRQDTELLIVHVHGMGDGARTAFKDGVLRYTDAHAAELYMLELDNDPWCAPAVIHSFGEFLTSVREVHPGIPIVLSGTSMGGCIVLSAMLNADIRASVIGVITYSASSMLDNVFLDSSSPAVRQALEDSVAGAADARTALREHSLHYALPAVLPDLPPLFLAYTKHDTVVPSGAVRRTAQELAKHGDRVMLYPFKRRHGHNRPWPADVRAALAWILAQRIR